MNARVSYSFQRFPYSACPARSRGNPKISLWLSVDPLAEKYPGMSPYNYTAGNPVNLIDPTGKEPENDIFVNTKTKEVTVVKTDDNFDRWIVNGKHVGNIPKGVFKKESYEKIGFRYREVKFLYGKNADKNKISFYSRSVLIDIMNKSNENSIFITSTARTPEEQARIMINLVKQKGLNAVKALYKRYGDMVLDQYPDKEKMIEKIYEVGPQRVSRHLADPSELNVIDISPRRLQDPRRFARNASNNPQISKVLSPYNSTDPAIHIEIPQ